MATSGPCRKVVAVPSHSKNSASASTGPWRSVRKSGKSSGDQPCQREHRKQEVPEGSEQGTESSSATGSNPSRQTRRPNTSAPSATTCLSGGSAPVSGSASTARQSSPQRPTAPRPRKSSPRFPSSESQGDLSVQM